MHGQRTLGELLHDVTNSLGLIAGYSQYLLETTAGAAAQAEPLQVVWQEAERAATLIACVPEDLAQIRLAVVPGGAEARRSPRHAPPAAPVLLEESGRGARNPDDNGETISMCGA
ncbi:MAG: hypothetical protein QME96_14060, partial [Myxococcota bacterium]|nr:hypothetical protein [Myxococcota bacterium]